MFAPGTSAISANRTTATLSGTTTHSLEPARNVSKPNDHAEGLAAESVVSHPSSNSGTEPLLSTRTECRGPGPVEDEPQAASAATSARATTRRRIGAS